MAVLIKGWTNLIPNPEALSVNKENEQVSLQDLDDLKFEYEERCAILEFYAGLTRKKAEEFSKSILSNKSK